MKISPNTIYIDELAGEDVAFKETLISVLKEEFSDEVGKYETSYVNNDIELSAAIVHKLKHKFSMLGVVEGYELAIVYEEELKRGVFVNTEKFKNILSQVQTYLMEELV